MKEPKGIQSILRATAILSSSTLVTILLGIVSAKVTAVILKPEGYGYMGLLQAMVALGSLVTGLGVGSGVVKMGASRVAQNDQLGISRLRQAGWLVIGCTCALALGILLVFRRLMSGLLLGSVAHPWTVALMGIAVVLTVSTNFQANIMNAYHRVEALAKNSAVGALLGGLISIAIVVTWRAHGIVPAVIGSALGAWVVSLYLLHREVGSQPERPPLSDTLAAAGSLVRFGGPYTASMLVGTGVTMALPIMVVHMLGTESVGYYRASSGIAVTYLGLLITSMAQDYYPRVSAISDQPAALNEVINKQQRLVLLLGVPMILGMLALVPYLVPLAYSSRFMPSVGILEWQLIADLFKFSSWTLAYVILARCSSTTYFLIELLGGATTFGTSWLGMRWFGLPGLGMSFLATYLIYYAVVWAVVRKETHLVWTDSNKWMMVAAAAAAFVVRLCPYVGMARWRTPVALALAAVAGAGSLRAIWGEVKDTATAAKAQRVVLGLLGRAET